MSSRQTGGVKRIGARVLRSRLFRAAVSAGLVALIVSRLDLPELRQTLAGVAPGLLALGVLIFLMSNAASIAKWRLIVHSQGRNAGGETVSYLYLTSLFYIGLFFNNFLPTNFGGDVIRAYKLARVTGRPADSAGSVVLDRVSSTFALLLIALVPVAVKASLLGTGFMVLVIVMFAASLLLAALFASERSARRLGRLPFLKPRFLAAVREHLKGFYYSLHEFRKKPGTLAAVLALSLIYQALHVMTLYVFALSLGIEVPLIYYYMFLPVVLVAGMLPVSLNGLGVREGAWVLLFGRVGVSAAEAFSISLMVFMAVTVVSLAGGVFYLFDRAMPAPKPEADSAAG